MDIGTASTAIGLVDKLYSLYRRVLVKIGRRKPLQAFEVRPMYFRVYLLGNRPSIEIKFYAINYLSEPISVKEINVRRIQFQGGDELNSIALSQENIAIPAHESIILICYRNLIDSEIRSLASEKKYQSGSFEMTAKAIKKSNEYSYGPVSSMSIEGKIEGGQA